MATPVANDDGWVYRINELHQPYIVDCMKFVLGQPFEKTAIFTREQLVALRPVDIVRWLQNRAYGKPDITDQDRPTQARSGSIEKAKGAVSACHPYQHVPWIQGVQNHGNPTRHPTVNAVITKIQKYETRGEGRPTRVKREYSTCEFLKLLEILRDYEQFELRLKYPLITLWSYHLVHRLDDSANFKLSQPKGCTKFPFAIMTKTKWSKNVRTERQCPDQIMFGAEDSRVCIQLWLALYMEEYLEQNADPLFLFTNNTEKNEKGEYKGPHQVKTNYYNNIRQKVFKNEEFKLLADVVGAVEEHLGLGSHSNRKFSASYAKLKGALGAQVEGRGRWVGSKGGSIAQTVYISPKDEWEDAYVASLLCMGGAIRYAPRTGLVIPNEFLFQHVVPNIRRKFANDDRFCRVMGLAYLHALFEPALSEFIDTRTAAKVKAEFVDFFTVEAAETNPVVKIPLEIYRVDENLHIADAVVATQPTNADQQQPPTAGANTNEQRQINNQQQARILSYMRNMDMRLQEQMQQIQRQQQQHQNRTESLLRRIMSTQRRYGGTIQSSFARPYWQQQNRLAGGRLRHEQTGRRMGQQQETQPAHAPQPPTQGNPPAQGNPTNYQTRRGISANAVLVERPRSLFELWEEYQTGIHGNKPAKNFTSAERNNRANGIKQKYYRRNKVWQLQLYLIEKGGLSIHDACDKIMRHYNSIHITHIISGIIKDNKTYKAVGGMHPNLRLNAVGGSNRLSAQELLDISLL